MLIQNANPWYRLINQATTKSYVVAQFIGRNAELPNTQGNYNYMWDTELPDESGNYFNTISTPTPKASVTFFNVAIDIFSIPFSILDTTC